MLFEKDDRVKAGDRIVVTPVRIYGDVSLEVMHSIPKYVMKVESVSRDPKTGVVTMHLNGEHGKCRVYVHDEGKTWHRHEQLN